MRPRLQAAFSFFDTGDGVFLALSLADPKMKIHDPDLAGLG
jgi:hypothetical protein